MAAPHTTGSFREVLRSSLKAAIDERAFDEHAFFDHWFRDPDQFVFFLFKKNLKVTNIQFSELFSLMKIHITYQGNSRKRDLQFISMNEFKKVTKELTHSQLSTNIDTKIDLISRLYSRLFFRTVVVQPFFGSCAAFIPRHFDINIESICCESGYIHSAGYCIFVRSMAKCDQDFILKKLRWYLDSLTHGKKVFFAAYSREDFSDFDRNKETLLRDGLDEVKIDLDKHYVAGKRLVSVLSSVRTQFKDWLVVPEPGDFRAQQKHLRKMPDIDKHSTFWLIKDRNFWFAPAAPSRTVQTGRNRYYICYDQRYFNGNQFYLMDENKPAWIAHTTLPHTLAAAMINITRPTWPSTRNARVIDPFVGTGTSWFEAIKIPDVDMDVSDGAAVSRMLLEDNRTFFASSAEELDQIISWMHHLDVLLKKRIDGEVFSESNAEVEIWAQFEIARAFVERLKIGSAGDELNLQAFDEEMKNFSYSTRLLVYIWFRALVRRAAAIERNAEGHYAAFQKEMSTLLAQMREIQQLYDRKISSSPASNQNLAVVEHDYSKSCMLRPQMIASRQLCWAHVDIMSKRTEEVGLCPYDVVVCDPPYGYNTSEEAEHLAHLYKKSIEEMILWLRDGGHLVMCLLDTSFTGRRAHFFIHPNFITAQVLAIAAKLKRDVIVGAARLPEPRGLFEAPFYWEAERALRRSILHFRIRRRPSTEDA